ncbi:hypothetical protein [Breznakiella homolactica]|uniref:Uncharacterized protein n=1 Tax=Breznakiella homolactica TaxID=2798577 RepID=A0A7T7XPV8_9SPIR|nr:hypothetical protein [Breznakiella homolactica]QQO10283.1 hypothetical protein JFL75_05010 [Breznakiella homolactica]
MAKKTKAIYAPGELDRVRRKLGDLNPDEARRMAEVLGGEVGWERDQENEAKGRSRVRNETVDVVVGGKSSGRNKQPKRRVELAPDGDDPDGIRRRSSRIITDPGDDPSIPLKLSYRERVKMDRYAAQPEFEIKNAGQVFYSVISIFGDIPDYVNPDFVNRRMNDYYKRIELLVTATRTMFPRNNLQRNERLRKASPFAYSILDTIRYWNIERIASDLAKIQAKPRNAKIGDFADILRAIYKPIYVLEKLDPETHIRESYKLLYKVLYLENPTEAKAKYQDLIRNALSSYVVIQRDIKYLMYPLLLKLLSDQFIPYDNFFTVRKNRFAVFLGVNESKHISPSSVAVPVEDAEEEKSEDKNSGDEKDADGLTSEERELKKALEAENKAVNRGENTLEILFPRAGWERMATYPDFYPYFHDVFNFKKGYELISPTDPLQQIVVLMRILEELFYGLRYVSFGTTAGPDGNPERIDNIITNIMTNWHTFIELGFEKEYLPRLTEYCRILDSASESRTSTYARRILNELHWIKRLYFLPYYRFESSFPPPMQKKDVKAVYPEVRKLRRYLTAVAAGIEQGNRRGGAENNAHCDAIDNPWEPYNFQVPNPVSTRIDAVLGSKNPKQKNNAALVFFTLSAAVVLDHIMNDENSWAYGEQTGWLFRSVDGDGVMPLFGVDTKLDTETIFKHALKQRERKEAGNKEEEPDF